MQVGIDQIYNEDCLAGMKRIPDGSVDCIICDWSTDSTKTANTATACSSPPAAISVSGFRIFCNFAGATYFPMNSRLRRKKREKNVSFASILPFSG